MFAIFSVPPNEPQIKSSEGVILSGLTEPYNEGSTLKLTCTATGGELTKKQLVINIINQALIKILAFINLLRQTTSIFDLVAK